MALDKFQPYLFVSAGEQSNKYLTPVISPDGIASFQAQRAQDLTGLTVRIDPIQEGTGDPSPTNIRPISGRTGMTVNTVGRNLLPKQTTLTPTTSNGVTFTYNADGSITADGTSTATAMSRAVSFRLPFGNYRKSDRTLVQYKEENWRTVTGGGPTSNAMTIDEDIELVCRISIASGVTVDNVTYYPYIYSESDTSTEYVPYAGESYSVAWENEAGTVYGGTLDVVSGVLTVDRAAVDLGDMSWGWSSNGYFFSSTIQNLVELPKTASEKTTAICSMYKAETTNDIRYNTVDNAFGVVQVSSVINAGRVWIRDTSKGTDTTEFKTAVTGQTLVYPLATPQTYQLTPTEVRTIAGFNQIYSDAGPVIDIKF